MYLNQNKVILQMSAHHNYRQNKVNKVKIAFEMFQPIINIYTIYKIYNLEENISLTSVCALS